MLIETYLNKMVQIRVMEYLRVKAKSVVPAVEQAEVTFRRLGSHTQTGGAIVVRDYAGTHLSKGRNNAASILKTYLTDIDFDYFERRPDKSKPLKRSKSQPLKINPSLAQEIAEWGKELFKGKAGVPVEKRVTGTIEDMNYPELMEMLRSIVSQKADPE